MGTSKEIPGVLPLITMDLSVTGQNGSGQNGTDKMVYGQNGIGQNGTDKMAWTKWYNFIFCVHFNSVEFNICLVSKIQK